MGERDGDRYSDEEVREILRRAVDRQPDSEGLTRADLHAAARDIGISAEALDQAIADVREKREIEVYRERLRAGRKRRFLRSVSTWAVVNAGLFGIDFLTSGGEPSWFLYPLLIWGGFLALRGVRLLWSEDSDEDLRRRVRRDRERERARRDREAERRRKKEASEGRRRAEEEFEGAVERGVTALLGAAARKLDGSIPGGSASQGSEFHAYVDRRQREERGEDVPPSGDGQAPRTRVPDDGEREVEPVEEEASRTGRSRRRGR